MKLKHIFAIAGVALAAVVAVVLVLQPDRTAGEAQKAERKLSHRGANAVTNVREKVRQIVAAEPKKGRRVRPVSDMFPMLKGKDRQLAEDIQNALDADNYSGVLHSVDRAMRSDNPEVRSLLVDALGWFGSEALPELTELMADADPDVAESAQEQWSIALAEVEDPGRRMEIGMVVMGTLTDADMLEQISGEVSNSALEYIDGEDDPVRQDEKRLEVVQSLLDIMDGDRKACAEAAAETYEDITGYPWRGVDEAERYLNKPDDYELPEDRDEVMAEAPGARPAKGGEAAQGDDRTGEGDGPVALEADP